MTDSTGKLFAPTVSKLQWLRLFVFLLCLTLLAYGLGVLNRTMHIEGPFLYALALVAISLITWIYRIKYVWTFNYDADEIVLTLYQNPFMFTFIVLTARDQRLWRGRFWKPREVEAEVELDSRLLIIHIEHREERPPYVAGISHKGC
jgi:hypothetical protein